MEGLPVFSGIASLHFACLCFTNIWFARGAFVLQADSDPPENMKTIIIRIPIIMPSGSVSMVGNTNPGSIVSNLDSDPDHYHDGNPDPDPVIPSQNRIPHF